MQFDNVAIVVALALLLTFLGLYGYAVYCTWATEKSKVPEFPSQFVYVATALAGLVGGVAAAAFNLPPPTPAAAAGAPAGGPPAVAAPSTEKVAQILDAADPRAVRKDWQNLALLAYVYSYLIGGLAAIITWALRANTPDVVKNLALISLGLLLAIARGVF